MAAIMQVENPGNPRMETRLGFGIGIGLDSWRYVTLVRTARGASRRAGVRYKSIVDYFDWQIWISIIELWYP